MEHDSLGNVVPDSVSVKLTLSRVNTLMEQRRRASGNPSKVMHQRYSKKKWEEEKGSH